MATAKAAKKTAAKPMERIVHQAEELGDRFTKRAELSAEETRQRAARLALAVLEFEKTTFDNTFKMIDKLQKHTEALVREHIGEAEWMPDEGRAIVEEWTRMLQSSRSDFHRTVDKSFDHITGYVKRLQQTSQAKVPKKAAMKKADAKKAPAKKPAARKSTKSAVAARA